MLRFELRWPCLFSTIPHIPIFPGFGQWIAWSRRDTLVRRDEPMPKPNERSTGQIIPSGHFRVSRSAELVRGGAEATYRVFNTGEAEFELSGIAGKVQRSASVDVVVPKDGTLTVTSASVAEGVFDRLSPEESGRSGRVNIESTPMVGSTEIAVGLTGACYRFLNSGRKEFVITTSQGVSQILPGRRNESRSIDVFCSTGSIWIAPSGTPPSLRSPYTGVYERVGPNNGGRAGRFKIAGETTPKARTIIAGGGTTNFDALYRFINAGKYPFSITVDGGDAVTLGSESSIDLQLNGLLVEVVAVNAGENIKGIYFML
ncbi:MAG: hypothetical protein ACK5Q5_09685 [Planctomycetaceae bacterium]